MEVLKDTSTCLFVTGLDVPKYFKNKALVLFASTFMVVFFFYIGFGYEALSIILTRNLQVFGVGFVCFNLAAFFAGAWVSCIVHEVAMAFHSV
ncbi:ECU04_0155 [Encephalitozoon cuniculi GB-M1]|uniref:ECU04_0155 protein n=1 Tax=Encephalitozoon cuniculi (strain GB-M1) TaxID=284813 RepID=I7L8H4_ENCCU|nr:uncharacterized protein ECU04_0155 [Encephalitozoon cuniculi GB-M1]UYI27391.1 hypothetical protein J0A71_06g12580 [Encephalitozoon cuniculi]CCI73922.1 ECU04_0155 [Encephalitozoon cuniculi GB-M1]